MPDHVIRNGLDIPIAGGATGQPVAVEAPKTVAYCPVEFKGIVPRLAAREGDRVKRGSPLFQSKSFPEMRFLSPVSGTVKEIRRGNRRVITDLVVEADGSNDEETFPPLDPATASADDVRAALLARGQWAAFRTRPLNNIPKPDVRPQAILVCATETGPLQPGADVLLSADDKAALQAGLTALGKLTDTVHLTVPKGSHPALQGLTGVTVHTVDGPHPAGDPSVQVNLIQPPKGTGQVWIARAWDVADIGRALTTGRFPNERVVAAVGAGVQQPRFVRTVMGAPLQHVVGAVAPGEMRWIRGSVLTGTAVDSSRWLSHFSRAVHVLPGVVESDLLGWALPMFGTWSFYKTYLKGFTGAGGTVDMRPGVFGGKRAMVPIGAYGRVMVTPEILPEFLFKSIIANDLEEAIQLGLLDMTDEEAALLTYICPSKIEFDVLLREGLALYEKEAS